MSATGGSDRPVVEPDHDGVRGALDWDLFATNPERAFPVRPKPLKRVAVLARAIG